MDSAGRPRRSGLFALTAAFCLLFLLLGCAGCGGSGAGLPGGGGEGSGAGPGREIPLQTLDQGISSEYGRFDEMPIPEDSPPECLVLSDEEEYQRLVSLAFFPQTPAEVDFSRYVVIAAMQGPKSTGGYAISIMYASQAGTEVRVELEVVEPEPGSMTVQMLTSPYHLVLAERSSFDPRGELVFTFFDQDDHRISQQPAEL